MRACLLTTLPCRGRHAPGRTGSHTGRRCLLVAPCQFSFYKVYMGVAAVCTADDTLRRHRHPSPNSGWSGVDVCRTAGAHSRSSAAGHRVASVSPPGSRRQQRNPNDALLQSRASAAEALARSRWGAPPVHAGAPLLPSSPRATAHVSAPALPIPVPQVPRPSAAHWTTVASTAAELSSGTGWEVW